MELFKKSFKISASIVITVVLFFLFIGSLLVYLLLNDPGCKLGNLCGGLAAGLLVAIIQFLLAWQDYRQTEKLMRLKLKEVLYDRSSREQYAGYIKNCNRKLDVMGVTAARFFNDFADTSAGAPDSAKVLLQALEREIHVRVLLPSKDFLTEEKKIDAERVRAKYEELVQRHKNIEIRYFNHTPTHSIFRIDDTCIVGPVFPKLESRNTPALFLMNSSPFALNYLNYFEEEWNEAENVQNAKD